MAKLSPYLSFENAKEAMGYYENAFGATELTRIPVGKEMMEKFSMSQTEAENATLHGSFKIEGNLILCSDKFGRKSEASEYISLLIDFNSDEEEEVKQMDKLYEKIIKRGKVTLEIPLTEQQWGGKIARFTDKYGISWMLHSQSYATNIKNKEG